jgi:glycerophosphoryl diester phosphodiesterase
MLGCFVTTLRSLLLLTLLVPSVGAQDNFVPGTRTMVDAHNCYPYNGQWADRIDRALATGTPIGIEQDLVWARDATTGAGHSVLSHDTHPTGNEPTLESYFFAKVNPLIEAELQHPHPENWPIITLNLDFKTTEIEHLRAIREVLQKHKEWLTTAVRDSDASTMQTLKKAPILVFVGPTANEEQVFYNEVNLGSELLAFGAAKVLASDSVTAPEVMETMPADNFHRWWNNSWTVVEKGGASKAGPWGEQAEERLHRLIEHAHQQHLWIRFYTLDGETAEEAKANGWFSTYNFRSAAEATKRITALARLHADWIATDQYEATKATVRNATRPSK